LKKSGFKSIIKSGIKSGIKSWIKSGLKSWIKSGLKSGIKSGIKSGFKSVIKSGLKYILTLKQMKIKNVHIFGGGTVAHVASHFAVSAPAYGHTAHSIADLALLKFDNANVNLELTKMAGITFKL
jgi:hypothetical protein